MVSNKSLAGNLPAWATQLLKGTVVKKMMLREDIDALLLCNFLNAVGCTDDQLEVLHSVARLNAGESLNLTTLHLLRGQIPQDLLDVMIARSKQQSLGLT